MPWARRLTIALGIVTVLGAVALVAMVNDFVDLWRTAIANPSRDPTELQPAGRDALVVFVPQLLTPVQYGAIIYLSIWTYRAAGAATALGIRMRRSPGWAVGSWFIPVVNCWWPCQNLRDMLPQDHPTRQKITRLWSVGIAGAVVQLTGLGMTFAVRGIVPLIVTAVGALLYAGAIIAGRPVISDICAAHEQLARSAGAQAPAP